MIVFDLVCTCDHRFECWFASSRAYAEQRESGLVVCPLCGSAEIAKAPMAPAVPAKANAQRNGVGDNAPSDPLPSGLVKAMRVLAAAQAEALKSSTWVGDSFAETTRAMHYGEREKAIVHGRATREEAVALVDEGVAISPLPFPVAPPDELN